MTSNFGFLPLAKPPGPSSAEILGWLRRYFPVRRGHSGTLDPFAEGVLVVAVGKATRLLPYLDDETKEYFATICLGVSTDTDDCDGVELARAPEGTKMTSTQVEKAIKRMAGRKFQRPPSYSAIKIGGRRAYELARKKQPVTLAARAVSATVVEMIACEWPLVWVRLVTKRGFYVRAFARDLGEVLGVGGHLSWLYRTRSGPFRIEQCLNPIEIDSAIAAGADPQSLLIPPQDVLHYYPRIEVDDSQIEDIRHGKDIALADPTPFKLGTKPSPILLMSPQGEVLALANLNNGCLHPSVVLID